MKTTAIEKCIWFVETHAEMLSRNGICPATQQIIDTSREARAELAAPIRLARSVPKECYSRTIFPGERVKVLWQYGSKMVEGIVQHMPSDTGDLLYILDDDGVDWGINTNASNIECIVLTLARQAMEVRNG